jgi:hypothetical protein
MEFVCLFCFVLYLSISFTGHDSSMSIVSGLDVGGPVSVLCKDISGSVLARPWALRLGHSS